MKYLICGLGNIGDDYIDTRHNIGFVVLDALAGDLGVKFESGRYAWVAKPKLKGRQLTLIKPTTYMNLSGKSLRYWIEKEKIPLENSLIVLDDIDLDLGVLRMKTKGSGGTHNGLNNIIEVLGHINFPRLRIGIGKDFAKGFQIDYVLGRWTKNEEEILIPKIETAVEMIKNFVLVGIKRTMNQFNKREN